MDKKIYHDAMRLLSFGARSVEELRARLKAKKYPAGAVDELIETLKKQGFLNDEKFARLYANSRVYTRPSGKRQLEFDLVRKGLDPALVRQTVEGLSGYDEKAAAKELVRRRFESMSGIPVPKKKARLFGFLKRRGFSHEAIFGALDELFKNTGHCEERSDEAI